MFKLMPAAIAFALALPTAAARADPASDVAALRSEMNALRASYEARLQALEQRLKSAEASIAAPPPTVAAVPSPANTTAVVAASAPGNAGAFNPAISLILSGLYTSTSRDPKNYAITGFPLPRDADIGPGKRGFSLSESELSFAASIDPWLRGAASISIAPDNSVSVEEAYVQTTALGKGLSVKAGRFFSNVGYLNPQHAHTWDFVDNPLAYQAMLGTQYGDDGLQVSWLAPLDQFLELGLEVGRGRSYPGGDNGRNGAGMVALTAHTGGDIGDSSSWRAGVSLLGAKASDQGLVDVDSSGRPVNDVFNGRTNVWVVDAIWKWAPNGNATRTNFKLQGEYLRSTRSGMLAHDVDNAGPVGNYRAFQSGWYVQGIYQFMPRWRVGLRTEQVDPGSPEFGASSGLLATDHRPRKNSLMLDFSPSEFSRVRMQLAQDKARQGSADTQFFVQYQMSLGAHGAHSY
ncbi:MAG: hypothetical protein M3Z16_03675 [Pseudomonadota bacterium]|nr:hypothetical protein [Pseudomonadota bacterium]